MEQAKKILAVLESARFESFYNSYLDKYISGADDAPSKEQVLEKIQSLFASINN